MKKKNVITLLPLLVNFIITLVAFSFLFLPVTVSFVLYFTVSFFKERLLILTSINFTLVLALLIMSAVSGKVIDAQFNTPHDKLIMEPSFNYLNYPANKSLREFKVSSGDLIAYDKTLPDFYSSDRVGDFITDNLGFRNSKEFAFGDMIAVGDSYVVGNGGVSQTDTITSKLEKYTSMKFYNLGFPGDPFNYYHRLEKYSDLVKQSAGIILFIFEGNDLNCHIGDKAPPATKTEYFFDKIKLLLAYRLSIFDTSTLYKLGFGIYQQAYSKLFDRGNKTYRALVNGKHVAFLKEYVDVLYDDEICPKRLQEIVAIFDKYSDLIKMVVYVPTSGRIYHESLGKAEPSNKKIEMLRNLSLHYNLNYLNLTPFFLDKKESDLLYYSDDTHWNSMGIDLAAQVISEKLEPRK